MIRTFKGRIKTYQRPAFYSISLLLVINTAIVAWGMRSGTVVFPGWPFWRLSVVISAGVIWWQWRAECPEQVMVAGIMAFVWALLPVCWFFVAFWNWQLPVTDPGWPVYPSVFSSIICWLLTFLQMLFRGAR